MLSCNNILKNLSVLYVEDEQDIRTLLQEVLKDEFSSFDTAKDGEEGLRKFFDKKYDCVITDIEMEDIDGLTLAEKIRDHNDTIPIILLTAYSEKERLFRAIDVGVNKYLVKPFTPDKLLEVICDIFKKRLERKEHIDLGKGLLYNIYRGELKKNGEFITLTKKEKLFLDLLIEHKDRVVTFSEIDDYVWGGEDFSENALRTLVKRVRKKSYKELIKNFSGVGYKLNL
ncbi:MAG: response regulator transcription factor [Epsilonproteobacteria bacterium]|nr:response regulator transcription factor [Campylobacterota bacterium]